MIKKDSVLRKQYFGDKDFAKPRLIFFEFGVANGKGGVWGGIFHLLRFLFGGRGNS
jgi:hypothetical protein